MVRKQEKKNFRSEKKFSFTILKNIDERYIGTLLEQSTIALFHYILIPIILLYLFYFFIFFSFTETSEIRTICINYFALAD